MMQRGGRAGRNPSSKSSMTVLVERSVFTIQKIRDRTKKSKAKSKSKSAPVQELAEETADVGGKKAKPAKSTIKTGFDPERTELPEGYEWVKKIDPVVREFLSWKGCRRDFLDKHFGNPSTRAQCEFFRSGRIDQRY